MKDTIISPSLLAAAAHFETADAFLHSDEPLLLIVGQRHSGKSELLSALVDKIQVSRPVMRLRGKANLTPTDLTELLSKHWAIDLDRQRKRVQESLDAVLLQLQQHDQRCVLVVEHAHLLSLSVLAAIVHLALTQSESEGETRLHVVLSGQASLVESLQRLGPKRRLRVLQLDTYLHDDASSTGLSGRSHLPKQWWSKLETRFSQWLLYDGSASLSSGKSSRSRKRGVAGIRRLSSAYFREHRGWVAGLLGALLIGFSTWWIPHHDMQYRGYYQQEAQHSWFKPKRFAKLDQQCLPKRHKRRYC